ncbi:uncharacterized protein [Littorina saxatilis]|uniref:uncharacterized protein n=1 Tax=Littorina saxatilis TaxID=31220 RepID=UPI0038B4B5B2
MEVSSGEAVNDKLLSPILLVSTTTQTDIGASVSFTAELPLKSSQKYGPQLKFTNITCNVGQGLRKHGDVFVVPIPGTYAFNVNIHGSFYGKDENSAAFFELKVEGVEIPVTFNSSGRTARAVVTLDKGRRVTVCVSEPSYGYGGKVTFSGALIREC